MVNGVIMILKKFKLVPISGDASFRKYYRKFNQKKKLSTIIVISKKEKNKNLLVYSAINQFLLDHNIRAPRLLTENYKKGFIEIEDFGNITIYNILKKVDFDNIANLNSCIREIRKIIEEIPIPQNILALISENYNLLGTNVEVAVRSSATAEDLPTASFAGQMDSFLFIRGTENVIKSIKKTFSSMFSPRAIYYRNEKGFNHFSVKISITIQRMLSPKSAGVMFTLNPVDGNTDIIYIEGSWGVGETIVQGKV